METLENKIARHGKPLITDFHILLKMAVIYDSANEAVYNAASRLASDIRELLDETGELTLKILDGSFYIEGMRIKAGVSDIEVFTSLALILGRKAIGVLDFKSPVMPEDFISLSYAIKDGNEAAEIQALAERQRPGFITIGGPVALQREEGIDFRDSLAVAKRAYLKSLSLMRETDKAFRSGLRIKLKKIKRALQLMVDSMLTDETYLIGFSFSRNPKSYYYQHPINVAIFSVALGKRMGLDKVSLRTLALVSFLHDAGKINIPLGILLKPASLSGAGRELLIRHPVEGIIPILRTFGLNEVSILAMLVSNEHHMGIDLSGYPAPDRERAPNLYSRIVAIADEFDSLVSGMVDGRKKVPTQEALKAMLEKVGTSFDPVLMNAFADIFRS